MKQQRACIFFATTIISVLLFSHQVRAQEVEDEREFDYTPGSTKGPEKWGDLKSEWATCKNGSLQSPIDMSDRRVMIIKKSGELKMKYKLCNSTIKNRGHDISLQWEGLKAGSILINGSEYFLQQCHWHTPSEHTINGKRYDMELHMVHEVADPNVKNKRAVIGFLYEIGKPDAFLSKLLGHVMSMTGNKHETNMGMINPDEIKTGGKRYYRYLGSLTIPPCTEGVIWNINKKVRRVSKKQIKALREAVHDYAQVNVRPVQPLNRREVQLYGATKI